MLTKPHANTPTNTRHMVQRLIKIHRYNNHHYAMGNGSTFILIANRKELTGTHLVSPQGTSQHSCNQLNIKIAATHVQHTHIIRYQQNLQHPQGREKFDSTMHATIHCMTQHAQQLLFLLITHFSSRKMQQQRFIDIPQIQQSIAKIQYWIDVAKTPEHDTNNHSHKTTTITQWQALLKSTDLLCDLHGANSLTQHGCRDLYWLVFLYGQLLNTENA